MEETCWPSEGEGGKEAIKCRKKGPGSKKPKETALTVNPGAKRNYQVKPSDAIAKHEGGKGVGKIVKSEN